MNDILDYEKLVVSIAMKFKNYYDLEDLKQVGMIGLIKAYENYREGYGTKFSSYAYTYIMGEILKYVNDNRGLKLSKEIITLNSKINKAKVLMEQKLGREPTITEISLFLEVDENMINEAINANELVKSLDYVLNEDSDEKNVEFYNCVGYVDEMMTPEIMDLKSEIEKLPEYEQQLIYYRYYEDFTQGEVGKIFNTNQVSISRNETKILRKLKDKLAA